MILLALHVKELHLIAHHAQSELIFIKLILFASIVLPDAQIVILKAAMAPLHAQSVKKDIINLDHIVINAEITVTNAQNIHHAQHANQDISHLQQVQEVNA